MKKSRYWLLPALMATLLSSCGMDFDTQVPEEMAAAEMNLDYHEAWMFVGDTLDINPVFHPDSVANKEIYWESTADSVLSVSDNHFIGLSAGESKVIGISVNERISDTCSVTVMEPWTTDLSYPADMVIYARVTLHGQPIDSTMMVGAFCNDELRGLGRLRTSHGITYTELRVWSEYMEGEDPEMPWMSETISFRLYEPRTHKLHDFPQTITYDIESHGTLSNLYELSIP